MCGIAGIFDLRKKVLKEDLMVFTDSMKHRGPDGSGYTLLASNHLGLGHRRLSILDLSEAGSQPMHLLEGRYTIVYNGEVFNFLELRRELQSLGYAFVSDTDTEVFALAYHHWGTDCFNRFNGMWAAAIWDEVQQELLLCRDRFGIKPLYCYISDAYLAFASETNAFRHLKGHQRSINDSLFLMNLAEPYALEGASLTPFNDIIALPPGNFIRFGFGGGDAPEPWFSPDEWLKNHGGDLNTHADTFRSLFMDAVSLRLRADVPIATALSGGLDSSSVFSAVVHLSKQGGLERTPADFRRAFIASFPGTELDELEYARQVLQHTGAEGTVVTIDPHSLAAKTEQLTRSFDCISANPLTAIHSVYEGMAQAGFRISLDGHGVDEMMFGYRDMVAAALEWQKWNASDQEARSTFGVLSGLYAPEFRHDLEAKFNKDLAWASGRRNTLKYRVGKLLKKPAHSLQPFPGHAMVNPQTKYQWPISEQQGFPWKPMPEQIAWLEFFKTTLPALLRNYDKASMLNSVEIRMPFMDWRLVMYTLGLPLEHKMGQGYTKLVLREAMRGVLAESVRTRTWKVGFMSPVQQWFNEGLSEWVMDTIQSQSFRNRNWWQASKVISFAEEQRKEGWSKRGAEQVWKLINAHLIAS
jgi:asparagine synthase (glutamine-hydrolysing)